MRTTFATTATHAPEGILHQGFGASRSAIRQFAMIVAATGFVALCAHVSVPLPFTLVPLTLQTFAVMLLGMVMGPGTAFAALTLYLVEGAVGLPVFSQYGPGGFAKLLGPTGGYLFSYPLAAALTGSIVRRFTLVQIAYGSRHNSRRCSILVDAHHGSCMACLCSSSAQRCSLNYGRTPIPAG